MIAMRSLVLAVALACALGFAAACGSDDSGGDPGPGNVGVGQGGAQDFGAFRQIIDEGKVPGPDTLDSVGFLNEHKIELPDPDCGHDVCVHGLLGVMGNLITSSNCTMVVIGMNSPIDLDAHDRPPLNLAIAIDTSGSMAGEPIARVREGLERMLSNLEPEDRVSLVSFSDEASLLADDSGDFRSFVDAVRGLQAEGSTNIYAGLRAAYDQVERRLDPERQNRVILLSDGEATSGLLASARIAELGRAYAERGIALSTIGMGNEFDVTLLRTLAEVGSGTFHFVEDNDAVREVFSEEVGLVVVPLAQRASLSLDLGSNYDLRAVYGTRLAELDAGGATIDLPALYVAHRLNAEDDADGRRGGGGVIVAELSPADEDKPGRDVGSLAFAYDDPLTLDHVEQEVEVRSPPIDESALRDGYFGGPGVEKAFVALNVFAGLDSAAHAATAGDYGAAVSTLEALEDNAGAWLHDNPDPDIEDDLRYVRRFIGVLTKQQTLVRPVTPPEPWPRD